MTDGRNPNVVRYDGRGYGYFSLIKPDDKDEEYCPCGDLPLRLCECDEPVVYDGAMDLTDED